MDRLTSSVFLASLLFLFGCSTNGDKCRCTGILCDSPCSIEDIKTYRKMTYFKKSCNCMVQISDQTINESYRIPKRSFLLSPKLGDDSIFVEMNLDPNTVTYSGDTVFYDSLISNPFYPDREPKSYSYSIFEDGKSVNFDTKTGWLRQIKMESVPDDAGNSHGVRTTYQFRIEWNGSWLRGEVVETARDML